MYDNLLRLDAESFLRSTSSVTLRGLTFQRIDYSVHLGFHPNLEFAAGHIRWSIKSDRNDKPEFYCLTIPFRQLQFDSLRPLLHIVCSL
jgi:hypothetical protein